MNKPEYILPLEIEFRNHADPANAVQMQKYMKDKFEFFGINSPLRKEIYGRFKKQYGLIPEVNKTKIIKWCWNAPQREYQYFVMEFLGKTQKKVEKEIIDLYVDMITNKSWWDTVDFIAAHLAGSYFKQNPESILELTTRWMNSDNMWLQRTCLLFQLRYKTNTDTQLLSSFIKPLSSSNEFFIRKAIGWALREYSKTDPDFVMQFVKENALAGLSEREALKWLRNKGKPD